MPKCSNCNADYSEHAWRSGKGACKNGKTKYKAGRN